MSCKRYREALLDGAAGALSPVLEVHLSGCEACRTALAAERALMDRIVTELEDGLATGPSPAFLPGVRRRVAEVRAPREPIRRWWPLPGLATLAGVLAVGYFAGEALRDPTPLASPRSVAQGQTKSPSSRSPEAPPPSSPAEPTGAPSAPAAVPQGPIEAVPAPASEASSTSSARRAQVRAERIEAPPVSAPEASSTATRRAAAAALDQPRVFVPPEDAQTVRRLALRLKGRAARATILDPGPESSAAPVDEPFDFTLRRVENQPAALSLDDRVLEGAEPALVEPPSFDLTFEKAGRKT
jgi:hypothetical protein